MPLLCSFKSVQLTRFSDCHWNMFLAANIIPLACSQALSSGDMSNSQKHCDVASSGGRSQGSRWPRDGSPKYKSLSKKSVPTDGREK